MDTETNPKQDKDSPVTYIYRDGKLRKVEPGETIEIELGYTEYGLYSERSVVFHTKITP